MTKYDTAVLIGRFQPFHLGHRALLEHAARLAANLIVVIGSHRASTLLRTPFAGGAACAFVDG